jgi:hypothetical protein
MRKLLALLPVLCSFFISPALQAYSYAEAADPMTLIFKAAISQAQAQQWDGVKESSMKGINLQKGHLFPADSLQPAFDKAISAKNLSQTAEIFANLVYISIREKLHRNIKDGFGNIKDNKSRLGLARKSYLDILDGNVKKLDSKVSQQILQQFSLALGALGNPGLFGIGQRSPDEDAYKSAIKMIETLIQQAFPAFI